MIEIVEKEPEAEENPNEAAKTAEPENEPETEEWAEELPEFAVAIHSSFNGMIRPGETVRLTGEIINGDSLKLAYQWECDKGTGFEPVKGETGLELAFTATAESLGWSWRLNVTIAKAE